ncbi:MAG: hypothetical protein II972_05330 [Elusimicrobiaceae bacterium]|nr:hypothetical protein [Elusimicrobiaceae bacterium]
MTQEEYKARYYEVGPNGQVPLWTLQNYFQQSASTDAHTLSFGLEELFPKGLGWVVTKLQMEFLRPVTLQDTFVVKTWHCLSDRLQSRRDFEISVNEQIVARGASWWVIIDLNQRKMVRTPQAFLDSNATNPKPIDIEINPFKRAQIEDSQLINSTLVKVRLEDLDTNGHTNNPHFSAWCLGALPASEVENLAIKDFVINFKAEALRGDEIDSLVYKTADNTYTHILKRRSDGKEIATALSVWRNK